MNSKKVYSISALVFIAALVSLAFLTVHSYEQANVDRNQDTIIDDISNNLNVMTYSLNEYSVGSSQNSSQWNATSIQIQYSIAHLVVYNSAEKLLVNQMQDFFSRLSPLLNLITSSEAPLNQTKISIWNNVFILIQSLLSTAANLSSAINHALADNIQNILFITTSFILTLIAFVCFIYFQIFGHTIKESENLEQKERTLELLVSDQNKQLRNSERLAAIGQTAGMVGHDIRNPLQSIVSDVYILEMNLQAIPDIKIREEAKESLQSIEINASYINKIVADLQDYARPLKPEFIDVDLFDLINTTIKSITIPDKVNLSISAQDCPQIKTDPTFVRRSLNNLVNNSIQAMPDGGNLDITYYKREKQVFIIISDSGKGIPEEVKAKLFTPLVTTKATGQGLGLAVVKLLIEALNGKISFESQEGKGTKFTIQLPI